MYAIVIRKLQGAEKTVSFLFPLFLNAYFV